MANKKFKVGDTVQVKIKKNSTFYYLNNLFGVVVEVKRKGDIIGIQLFDNPIDDLPWYLLPNDLVKVKNKEEVLLLYGK